MFENKDDFIKKLELMLNNYDTYLSKMSNYPNDAEQMSKEYFKFFIIYIIQKVCS